AVKRKTQGSDCRNACDLRAAGDGRGFSGIDLWVENTYLTTAEVAALLRVKPKTIRNKVASGIFREGEHFYRKVGLGPRWKRDAVIQWIEGGEPLPEPIPMARSRKARVAQLPRARV